jgi:hypothetical protein
MSTNQLKLKIIDEVQSNLLEYIETENKSLSKSNNLQNSAYKYALLRHTTLSKIKRNLGVEAAQSYAKSNQYDFVGLFGFPNKVDPLHQHIRNPRLYWALFGLAIKSTEFPSLNYDLVKKSYEIKDRLKLSLDARSYSYAFFQIVHQDIDETLCFLGGHVAQDKTQLKKIVSEVNSKAPRILNACIGNNISTKKVQKSYVVFRGIDIDRTQNVRVGRYKRNNLFFEKQESGKGFSFTTDKDLAIRFSISKFIEDEYSLGISRERRFDNLSFLFEELKVSRGAFFNVEQKRPYVIKYKVDREDILIDASGAFEREVMIDPDNVKIVSYFLPKY